MGRSFCTVQEAAARLGKSKRSIYGYIKKGFLVLHKDQGKGMLDREDVEKFAATLADNAPVVSRQTIIDLTARIRKLENEMTAVLHALDLRSSVLRLSPETANNLCRAAKDALTRRGAWTVEEVQVWGDQFEKIDELTLDSLCASVQDAKAWVPFFQLCIGMLEYAQSRGPDIQWQRLAVLLDNGRIRLRGAVLLFVEAGRGASPETLLGLSQNPREALLTQARAEGAKGISPRA
jgi:excisionase family DNA binding protein